MIQTAKALFDNHEVVKHTCDTAAIGAAVATFFKLLPDITALFALAYLLIRIYETKTVQRFLNRRKRGRK